MEAAAAVRTCVRDIAEGGLAPAEALEFVTDEAFGGQALFVGRVRRDSHGRRCTAVHYDLFEPLALARFTEAAQAAIARYGPALRVYVAHARGRLAVGDVAVVVAAASPHRDEAFRACRDVIEFVKHRAPIWKQEHFVDGHSAWSEGCSLCGVDPVPPGEAGAGAGA